MIDSVFYESMRFIARFYSVHLLGIQFPTVLRPLDAEQRLKVKFIDYSAAVEAFREVQSVDGVTNISLGGFDSEGNT